MAMTSAERQRKRREKLKDCGEKEILVQLDRNQQKALQELCAKYGLTVSQAIGWAIETCRSRAKKFKDAESRIIKANEQTFTRCEDGIFRACD